MAAQGCHGFPDNTTLDLDDALPANQSYFTYRCRLASQQLPLVTDAHTTGDDLRTVAKNMCA